MSVKGISRFAQMKSKDAVLRRVSLTGHQMNSNNVRVGSTGNRPQTFRVKISPSAFLDKLFILVMEYIVLLSVTMKLGTRSCIEILEDYEWGEQELGLTPECSAAWAILMESFVTQ